MKHALLALTVLTGCAAPVPPGPSAVTGEGQGTTLASQPPLVKAGHHARKSLPRASRHLRRRPLTSHNWRQLTVTAYCYTGSRNAAGEWPTVGTAAANAYPLGTRLRVEGIGAVVVEDRSAPGATDVDIYMGGPGCAARAAEFGRRVLRVEVLPVGSRQREGSSTRPEIRGAA